MISGGASASGELETASGKQALESRQYKWEPKVQAIWRNVWGKTRLSLYSTVQSNTFEHMEDKHMLTWMDSLVTGLTTDISTYANMIENEEDRKEEGKEERNG